MSSGAAFIGVYQKDQIFDKSELSEHKVRRKEK